VEVETKVWVALEAAVGVPVAAAVYQALVKGKEPRWHQRQRSQTQR
jgi:hypothetical protein